MKILLDGKVFGIPKFYFGLAVALPKVELSDS
jgi:hypothetical protein